jgi:AraC-like DNA-binding protein
MEIRQDNGIVERQFHDLDEMAAAILHADVEFVPLATPAQMNSRLMRLDLDESASLQIGEIDVPHLAHAVSHTGVYQLGMPLASTAPLVWNGHAVERGQALLYRPGSEMQATVPVPDRCAMFTVPLARFQRTMVTLWGTELPRFPENCRVARPTAFAGAQLTDTIDRVQRVAREDPGSLSSPEARRALTEQLLGLTVQALEGLPDRPAERERTLLSHSRIVGKAEEFMRARLALPLYVADLCQATGVSERTLRSAFRNVYGVGPNRFLKLRRLNQVRRVLQRAGAGTLVSEVATRHGFWDLGRFAGDYRRLFSESPSQTLRRSEEPQRP